jgi:hypothetical protein
MQNVIINNVSLVQPRANARREAAVRGEDRRLAAALARMYRADRGATAAYWAYRDASVASYAADAASGGEDRRLAAAVDAAYAAYAVAAAAQTRCHQHYARERRRALR